MNFAIAVTNFAIAVMNFAIAVIAGYSVATAALRWILN
jgi:hypothetical protein